MGRGQLPVLHPPSTPLQVGRAKESPDRGPLCERQDKGVQVPWVECVVTVASQEGARVGRKLKACPQHRLQCLLRKSDSVSILRKYQPSQPVKDKGARDRGSLCQPYGRFLKMFLALKTPY